MFKTDHTPHPGIAKPLGTDLRVLAAPNGGPMTFTGTNTYLLGTQGLVIIDPGPDDDAHLSAIEAAIGAAKVEAIIVTHAHRDHSALAPRLAARLGLPVHAARRPEPAADTFGETGGGEGIDPGFTPDLLLEDGQRLSGTGWSLEAVATPGHLSDHMALASGGRLFSGDHVMGWATTVISPPEGSLTDFMVSLDRCLDRPETVYHPGHGAPVEDPQGLIRHIRDHRLGREAQLLAALHDGPGTVISLTRTLYADVDPRLHGAAARNVLAHLIDLHARGRVAADRSAERPVFSLTRD